MANQPIQPIIYSDLPLNPTVTSNGDISTVNNADAIKQSLYMMMNTAKGSRIFAPNYGTRVRAFLFEMFDNSTAQRLGTEIQETIQNYEPRIQIISINVSMVQQTTSYEVVIVYKVVNTQQIDSVQVSLEKL